MGFESYARQEDTFKYSNKIFFLEKRSRRKQFIFTENFYEELLKVGLLLLGKPRAKKKKK